MLEFFNSLNLQTIIDFLNANPHIIGIFTFFIVFLEAMAVVGAIVPGVIVMPAIGFLIGSSVVSAGSTFLCAITGAIIGDCLSYFIGSYFKNHIHRMWPFTRWPNLLTHSEKFFHDHGGKSIVIGRFAGPTRAMIPMIAGMFKMPFLRFFLISVPSASFWAVGYMIPGVLLGALSLELPPKVATEFAVWGLLGFIALWMVVWLVQHYFRQIWRMIDYYIMQAWIYLQKHKESMWMTKFLSDPKEPDNHNQLTLLIIAFFMFILFLSVLYQVLITGGMVDLNHAVYHLLSSLRTFNFQCIFVLITFFANIELEVVAFGLIFLWLIKNRNWYTALHWLAISLICGVVISIMKFSIYYPRPGGILYEVDISSFPSAHVTFSLSFYGFLAVIIARELKAARKYIVYSIVATFIILIAFSRIYLGAHWLSDIVGGALLSLVMLLLTTIFYQRRHVTCFNVRRFIAVVLSVFFTVWAGYAMLEFKKQINKYELIWPEQTVTFDDLTKKTLTEKLPLYRLNRLGRPIEAFNVVYVGKLKKISTALSRSGWELQPVALDFQNAIKSFSATSVLYHLSIFPQLYHNRKAALLFTRNIKQDDVVLILRLWPSNINLEDSELPLWIGEVEYNHAKPRMFSFKHIKESLNLFKQEPQFVGATDFLADHLSREFHLRKKYYSFEDQPVEMRSLNWDGKFLVIMQ